MLIKSKPSTACCDEKIYISYLLSEPQYTSCTRLAGILETISHDSINRFLERERFKPKDLFEEEKNIVNLDLRQLFWCFLPKNLKQSLTLRNIRRQPA